MIGLFFVALLVPAAVFSTEVSPCLGGEAEPLAVRISGCDKQPCDLVRGTDVVLEVDFELSRDTAVVTPKVIAKALGVELDYPLPEDQRDGCKHLLNGYCPLDAGEEITYQLTMPVLSAYPPIPLDLTFKLLDGTKTAAACFKVRCNVK